MEEKYTTNPDFKGSKEEAEKQFNEYKEMNRWLADHKDLWEYEDSRIGGFKFKCSLNEVPECLLKYDKDRKAYQRKVQRALNDYRKRHGIGENESIIFDPDDDDIPVIFGVLRKDLEDKYSDENYDSSDDIESTIDDNNPFNDDDIDDLMDDLF